MTKNNISEDQFYHLVVSFFKGDSAKATLWYNTLNPMLGDVKPRTMIENGNFDLLVKAFYPNGIGDFDVFM